jgi:GAF domain-containing protein
MQARIDALEAEVGAAREREAATAEILGIINSSPGDLAPVFQAILEKAHSLCDAPCGSLQIFDGEQFRAVATRGMAEAYAAILQRGVRARVPDRNATVQFDFAERLAQDPGNQNARAAVEIGKLRTILFVPLLKDNVLIGRIAAARQEVRPFTDKQIALLQNFAAQAVIAMENARLITETQESLEQQTATAEVLQVINSSPGDLKPVFDALLEKVTRLCGAPRGQLATYDGEFFRFVAAHGEPGFTEGQFAQGATRPEIGVTWPRIVRGERFVHMVDVWDSELYRAGHESARRFVDVGGGRSLLTVALRKDEMLLGALTIYRQEVRPFTDKQIALLQNFAAQAVIAMENARLITETREALEHQTATAEVLQVINSSPSELAPVFDAMLEKAMRLCEAAFGILLVRDGNHFQTAAVHGMPLALAEFLSHTPREPGKHTAVGRMLDGEDFVQFEDMTKEPAYQLGDSRQRAFVELGGTRTYVAVALRKDGRLVGTIGAYRQEVRPFSGKQIALLQNFAAQAVIAMENARLLTETREALEQQTATAEVLGVINSSPGDLV